MLFKSNFGLDLDLFGRSKTNDVCSVFLLTVKGPLLKSSTGVISFRRQSDRVDQMYDNIRILEDIELITYFEYYSLSLFS